MLGLHSRATINLHVCLKSCVHSRAACMVTCPVQEKLLFVPPS